MDRSEFLQLCKTAEKRLEKAGIHSAQAEVEIIWEYLLDVDRLNVYLHGAELVDSNLIKQFKDIIDKRVSRYPLQYILGEAYFYGRRFVVSPEVMVPTPETELLCELAVNYVRNENIDSPDILDIGVGSGVISVTVAAELPTARITAVDISAEAIAVAKKNAGIHNVENQVDFVLSDRFENIARTEKFDLILSNPPYISENEYKELPPEVLADPKISLVSGAKGIDMIEHLILEVPDYLKKNGRLMFEIGYNQAELVSKISEKDKRYRSITILKDLNDIDRVAILSI
ncbi:MAG: peptide chain release factor N(5)-glutamine methyltransferase [Candidatus Zixiibacteriota bacterium]|nr:MAG: peptide chain release factor N(5)-glutamine methyltransferase [candidate division Zixibacteria bacterium]